MMMTGLTPKHPVTQRVLYSNQASSNHASAVQSLIRFQAEDHDHSQCNGHHHHAAEPQKPFSLTERLINLGTWFKEFFTGLWQDMIYLLKGPEAKEQATSSETDSDQHGPNCNH
jgi:hypothetical protein